MPPFVVRDRNFSHKVGAKDKVRIAYFMAGRAVPLREPINIEI